ncbi:ATP-grasp domain-containing protein [Paludisphaera soli]|uniref:ATP-grasp domain-containing protein n=1 Tax=Paludisphaera soli TaxID=2712865 RepID=UPI0013ED8E06|nr:ATP-grasp domain-containing protein [Paludisphaera soli]
MSWNIDPTTTSPVPRTVLIHEFVTGGGMAGETLPQSWASEGAAMRRALASEFAAAATPTRVLVTIDPRLPRDDKPWESVEVDSLERLEALAVRADYTLLIAPETGGVLESLTRRLGRTGCPLLGSEPEAVALTGDKAALGEWLDRQVVPTPRSAILEVGWAVPDGWPFPSVVKPIDGAGSLETYRVDRPDESAELAGAGGPRLLQEFVPGVAMSATFLVRGGRARLIAVGEQRIALRDGRFSYEGGTLPRRYPEAVPIAKAAVESIAGLRGLVGVDFILDVEHGRVVVLEINPRPTTSCVGLGRVLSPGLIAEAWLAPEPEEWDRLMDRIEVEIDAAAAVGFDASGRTWAVGESVEAVRS